MSAQGTTQAQWNVEERAVGTWLTSGLYGPEILVLRGPREVANLAQVQAAPVLRSAVSRAIEDIETVRCALHSEEVRPPELLIEAELRLRAALELAR
jgi:hypothetical protein